MRNGSPHETACGFSGRAQQVAGLEAEDAREHAARRHRRADLGQLGYAELRPPAAGVRVPDDHRNGTDIFLEDDVRSIARVRQRDFPDGSQHHRRPHRGVPGKRHLAARREDAQPPRVSRLLGRVDERRLGIVELPADRQEQILGDPAGVGNDGQLIPAKAEVREDVSRDEADGGQGLDGWWLAVGGWRRAYNVRRTAYSCRTLTGLPAGPTPRP